MSFKFSVGIDLGTTNCVVAYRSLSDKLEDVQLLKIPQVIQPGQIESRDSLPSFVYLPRETEVDSFRTSGFEDPAGGIVGHYARAQAAENPQRVVVAAKSWLCHSTAAAASECLPWQAPDEVPNVSAYECTRRLLLHLAAAWNQAHPDAPLAQQQVVLTVPASFAPSARELTRDAAIAAGLPDSFVLLEEPQAALYRWLAYDPDGWRGSLQPGDRLLVVDVGGGTTDLTLIEVAESDGELNLRRVAVGNHLLLGGDNMDLALAHFVSTRLAEQGHELDPWQSVSLWHACRDAKEQLLASDGPDRQTISVLGRGSSLIGGTVSTEISKQEAAEFLVEGFFPQCEKSERPTVGPASGFQDIGLPYESDAAITKHVAAFLADQQPEHGPNADQGEAGSMPTRLLFNGGVFQSNALRERMYQTISAWCQSSPSFLMAPEYSARNDLDTAVATGAAYYGWCKNHGGVRIRGGIPRSYYVGIETAGLAIPGAPRPLRALCVAARGMEEGTDADVPSDTVGLIVGKQAQFRFFSSSTRSDDAVGSKLDRWTKDELVENEPISVHLTSESAGGETFVPVRFHSRITELGMFELWCHSTCSDEKWKMEFNTRDES